MDKRTLLAVVLSVVIITVFFAVQAIFFPGTLSTTRKTEPPPQTEEEGREGQTKKDSGSSHRIASVEEEGMVRSIKASTGVFQIIFSTRGAVPTSIKLNLFNETDGSPVEMALSGETDRYPFQVALDEYDTGDDIFQHASSVLPNQWVFTKRYIYRNGSDEVPFTLTKTYVLKGSEYLMEVRVSLVTEDRQDIPVSAYTLSFGPQIGPKYEKLDNRNEFRRFIYYTEGKRKNFTGKVKKTRKEIDDRFSWLAVEGKYFLAIGISYISDLSAFRAGFDSTPLEGVKDHSSFYFDRSIKSNIKIEDGYKFYIGPKKRSILARYSERDKNEFQESGLSLEAAVPSSFWGWLSSILKWTLEMFYRLIPNWGVAIILLTIVIKIVFFPLTRKSFQSTHRMQELGPKIEELKAKHKNNQQKLNQEMAALYKREGVNPLGGCLPLLLQMPIFFALYSLFNNYFELRGAAFISPWIADLSSPERVFSLPFAIPFLGDEFRILPFIMLATTFIQQKVSQTPGQSQKQTKMLMYAMPLFFFFIMYNMPSGLLLYWTMQNLFTFITQYYINHMKSKKQDATGE